MKQVIWTGTATSDSRTDRQTGLPVEYRLTVYSTAEAECTCPAFLFQSVNNRNVAPADKLRFRCKHLARAFATNDFRELAAPAPPTPAPTPTNQPEVIQRRVIQDDLWFDDDTIPRIRR